MQIEPGRAAFIKTTLRPHRITWFGQKETHPFKLAVRHTGSEPLTVDGNYVQQRILPRWLLTALTAGVTVVAACVALWFARAPHVVTAATVSGPSQAPQDSAEPSVPAAPPASAPGGSGSHHGSGGSGSTGQKAGGAPNPATTAAPRRTAPPVVAEGQVGTIVGDASGLCVDVKDAQDGIGRNGTTLQIWTCNHLDDQKWQFYSDGTLRALGDCMDVQNHGTSSGTAVLLDTCNGNSSEGWHKASGNTLVNNRSGKCLDAKDQGKSPGTTLQIWTCQNPEQSNQVWHIKPITS